MKRIVFGAGNRSGNLLHVETEGCIVNIQIGLHKADGRRCTVVSVIPDRATMNGEEWDIEGSIGIIRVIRE